MTQSARTLLVFGIYLLILGTGLIFIPNLVLSPLGVPETSEVWIRVVGMLTFLLGVYYSMAARRNLIELFRMSVPVRSSVILFFVGFVLFAGAPKILVLFGAVDLVFAAWTFYALRQERTPQAQAFG